MWWFILEDVAVFFIYRRLFKKSCGRACHFRMCYYIHQKLIINVKRWPVIHLTIISKRRIMPNPLISISQTTGIKSIARRQFEKYKKKHNPYILRVIRWSGEGFEVKSKYYHDSFVLFLTSYLELLARCLFSDYVSSHIVRYGFENIKFDEKKALSKLIHCSNKLNVLQLLFWLIWVSEALSSMKRSSRVYFNLFVVDHILEPMLYFRRSVAQPELRLVLRKHPNDLHLSVSLRSRMTLTMATYRTKLWFRKFQKVHLMGMLPVNKKKKK